MCFLEEVLYKYTPTTTITYHDAHGNVLHGNVSFEKFLKKFFINYIELNNWFANIIIKIE